MVLRDSGQGVSGARSAIRYCHRNWANQASQLALEVAFGPTDLVKLGRGAVFRPNPGANCGLSARTLGGDGLDVRSIDQRACEVCTGHGFGEQKTLNTVTAQFTQNAQLVLALHPFGDGLQSQGAGSNRSRLGPWPFRPDRG